MVSLGLLGGKIQRMETITNKNVSIVSGGFDPLHVGHVELFYKAKDLSTKLIVVVNTDEFLTRKKSKPFMPMKERIAIVNSLKPVDIVIPSIDREHTVCETLKMIRDTYAPKWDLCFCNGGDRTSGSNTPEHALCEEIGITPIYGLGDKIQSSSWLTKE